jgi:hypothetical protein
MIEKIDPPAIYDMLRLRPSQDETTLHEMTFDQPFVNAANSGVEDKLFFLKQNASKSPPRVYVFQGKQP